jgi:hypothetical protein
MSKQYPGGIISKTPPVPSGAFENSTAPGIWTLEQQAAYAKLGQWPTAGNTQNFIEDVFSTYVYTGTGNTNTIINGINLSGKGGLVWTKSRSNAYDHYLFDTARGVEKVLISNTTAGQGTTSGALEQFNSNGYRLGYSGGGYAELNEATRTYVSWTFREQAKFFDIVTYTGNSTAGRTIAHNLGSAPGCMIVKRTDTADGWMVYHRSTNLLILNSTSSEFGAPATATRFGDDTNVIAPTSSVFTLGTNGSVNASGGTYVAYLFAHDAGGFGLTGTDNVISCGGFTKSGSSDVTVNLGFEPQWILMKSSSNDQAWFIFDTMRGMSWSAGADYLNPNSNAAETPSGPTFLISATGFTMQGMIADASYIYIAIRRGPMKVPTLGTSVFSPFAISNPENTKNTTNFPIDMQWWRYRAIEGANVIDSDRLRGISTNATSSGQFLRTPSSTSESTGSNTRGWDNTGFLTPVAYADTSTVLWNWRRAPGYFDTVCYTGTGVAGRTVSHNLTVTPELIIVKKRSDTEFWGALYVATSSTSALNSTAAFSTSNNQYYFGNDTIYVAPTSSVFTVGSVDRVNTSSGTYVAYLFATCAGVSKVGSYTGTGALHTVNCGFTTGARFVLIKRSDSTGGWYVWDSARGITAGNDPYILVNTDAGAEVTGTNYVDTDTTGFKVTAAAPAEINASGGTYIFLAIA